MQYWWSTQIYYRLLCYANQHWSLKSYHWAKREQTEIKLFIIIWFKKIFLIWMDNFLQTAHWWHSVSPTVHFTADEFIIQLRLSIHVHSQSE